MRKFMLFIAPVIGLMTSLAALHMVQVRKEEEELVQRLKAARVAQDKAPLAVKIISDTGAGTAWGYRGHLVTAAHVCRDSKEMDIIINGHAEKTTVLYTDPRADICVLSATSEMPKMLVRGKELSLKDKVKQCGMPGFDLEMACQTIVRMSKDFGLPKEALIPIGNQLFYTHVYLMLDGVSLPGMSGGPALNSKGQVIGLLTGGDGQTITLIAMIDELDRIIDRLK